MLPFSALLLQLCFALRQLANTNGQKRSKIKPFLAGVIRECRDRINMGLTYV
jgi:hypothetical protein